MGLSSSTNVVRSGVPLEELKSRIKPLDMFLFRGSGLLADTISELESKLMGTGEWTHCALVLTTEVVPIKNGKSGTLYLWESAAGDIPDVELGKPIIGVQVRELADVVCHYNSFNEGKVGWCRLLKNPVCDADGKVCANKTIEAVYKEYNHTPYDLNPFELASPFFSLCGRLGNNIENFLRCLCRRPRTATPGVLPWIKRDSGGLFCSELVALTYVRMGILPPSVRPHDIAPVEFLGCSNEQAIPVVIDTPIVVC